MLNKLNFGFFDTKMRKTILIVATIIIWAFVIYQSNKAWKTYQEYKKGVVMREQFEKVAELMKEGIEKYRKENIIKNENDSTSYHNELDSLNKY